MKKIQTLIHPELFPECYASNSFPKYCETAFQSLAELMPDADLPRVPGWNGPGDYPELVAAYSSLPLAPAAAPQKIIGEMAKDFLAGAVNWRCPDLLYNLGAAVNVSAAAIYALALDVNVYLINDGLAGNCVLAESAVANILAQLADVSSERSHGLFTFGGTGTNFYPIKVGTRKLKPDSGQTGLPPNIKVAVTDDAHFSHAAAADWAGIGTDNLIVLKPDAERRTDLKDADRQLRAALDAGYSVPAILINGGTTYDHAIDDVEGFVALRSRLVEDYKLGYVPHLHVDSVVGWAWLVFKDYDFEENPLEINDDTLPLLQKQYARISKIKFADSWGIDFHKGVGACPVDCSMVMMNDRADLLRLSKGGNPVTSMHQLAEDFSYESPVNYTLETSRAGGKALAALASFRTMGQRGYQAAVANLMECTVLFRREIERIPDMGVLNDYALGYQTMIRFFPPELKGDPRCKLEMTDDNADMGDFIGQVNKYLKAFFTWDNSSRMDINGGGIVYSFSKKFVRSPSGVDISGLKVYPVSPLIDAEHIYTSIEKLKSQKHHFDTRIWKK